MKDKLYAFINMYEDGLLCECYKLKFKNKKDWFDKDSPNKVIHGRTCIGILKLAIIIDEEKCQNTISPG